MSYSGAIKSNLYGIYLFISSQGFSVLSWRLTGILIYALALFLFGKVIGKVLPKYSLILVYLMLLSDVSILFMVRYDWGPVALALSLRLLFIAFWIKGELSEDKPMKWNSLVLGLIVGISIYEKLSSIVLIIPLIYIMLFNKNRRNIKHMMYVSSGFALGSLPLIVINVYTFFSRGLLLSWKHVNSTGSHLSISDFADCVFKYLSLGGGELVKNRISGVGIQIMMNNLEFLLLISLLFISVALFLFDRSKSKWNSIFWISLLSYLSLCIAIFFLPYPKKGAHHWIIGTPFQYMALSIATVGFLNKTAQPLFTGMDLKRKLFLAFIFVFLIFRSYSLFNAEKILIEGRSSDEWSPELTRLGEFAAKRQKDALFIAADWGVATQIYCLGDGKTRIYEIFWRQRPSTPVDVTLKAIINNYKNISCIYVALLEPPRNVSPSRTSLVIPTMKSLHEWKETEIEDEIKFENIRIYKFVKVNQGPREQGTRRTGGQADKNFMKVHEKKHNRIYNVIV
jgi:hypothetical protein